mgnify:CR=1 FL=1
MPSHHPIEGGARAVQGSLVEPMVKILDMLMSAFFCKNQADYHNKGRNSRNPAPYSLMKFYVIILVRAKNYLYFCNTNVNRAENFRQNLRKPVKICEIKIIDMLIFNNLQKSLSETIFH